MVHLVHLSAKRRSEREGGKQKKERGRKMSQEERWEEGDGEVRRVAPFLPTLYSVPRLWTEETIWEGKA